MLVPFSEPYQWQMISFVLCLRWKRDAKQEKVKDQDTTLPLLQFVAIQRRDTKEWAIPGVSSV